MFDRRSRYFRLNEVVAEGADGLLRRSVELRRPPRPQARFEHTVDAVDRLDHLGYQYYRRPVHWWRICDANPAFLSPLAMLGKDPLLVSELALRWTGDQPVWSTIQHGVERITGIEQVRFGNDAAPLPAVSLAVDNDNPVGSLPAGTAAELDAAVLNQQLGTALSDALALIGLSFDNGVRVGAPDEQRWQIESLADFALYYLAPGDGAAIDVFPVARFHDWLMRIRHNRHNAIEEPLFAFLDSIDAVTADTGLTPLSAAGKTISIPARFVG